jgi:hypothetical protein
MAKEDHSDHGELEQVSIVTLFNVAINIRTVQCHDKVIIEYGAVGGMRICRGNRSARRKPSPVPSDGRAGK